VEDVVAGSVVVVLLDVGAEVEVVEVVAIPGRVVVGSDASDPPEHAVSTTKASTTTERLIG
jgi:hypothetical protein